MIISVRLKEVIVKHIVLSMFVLYETLLGVYYFTGKRCAPYSSLKMVMEDS